MEIVIGVLMFIAWIVYAGAKLSGARAENNEIYRKENKND